jgi:transposase
MKSLSSVLTSEILFKLAEGQSYRQISSSTGVGLATITRIHALHCPTLPKSSGGCPKKISSLALHHLTCSVTNGSCKTAVQATKELEQATGVVVHPNTVRRSLQKAGLKAVHKQKKPLLSPKHKKARMDFALITKDWTLEDWKKVIWSDETKINLLGSDGLKWAWKKPGEPLSDRLVQGTLKFGGGSLMMWGCMSWDGIGYACKIDGRMNADLYVSILEDDLQASLEWWGKEVDEVVFQQDNDPKHTSKKAKECLKELGFRVLQWPAQSPDLNPIEHLWFHLKKQLGKYQEPPKSQAELWERVEKEWEAIPAKVCQDLISSMPKRVAAVLKAKGGYTKY